MNELYEQLMKYVQAGDEAGARKFLADNINEFPEEIRNELIVSLIEEAIIDQAEDIEAIAKIQEGGLKALAELDREERVIEDVKKINDIKNSL